MLLLLASLCTICVAIVSHLFLISKGNSPWNALSSQRFLENYNYNYRINGFKKCRRWTGTAVSASSLVSYQWATTSPPSCTVQCTYVCSHTPDCVFPKIDFWYSLTKSSYLEDLKVAGELGTVGEVVPEEHQLPTRAGAGTEVIHIL